MIIYNLYIVKEERSYHETRSKKCIGHYSTIERIQAALIRKVNQQPDSYKMKKFRDDEWRGINHSTNCDISIYYYEAELDIDL